jgi:uncharacterized protein YdeI (YjbR/CyaY-like superfamily)
MTALLTDESMVRGRAGVPHDLGVVLAMHPAAGAAFDRMSLATRREYIDWIESAGWTELRRGRVKRVLARVGVPARL